MTNQGEALLLSTCLANTVEIGHYNTVILEAAPATAKNIARTTKGVADSGIAWVSLPPEKEVGWLAKSMPKQTLAFL